MSYAGYFLLHLQSNELEDNKSNDIQNFICGLASNRAGNNLYRLIYVQSVQSRSKYAVVMGLISEIFFSLLTLALLNT